MPTIQVAHEGRWGVLFHTIITHIVVLEGLIKQSPHRCWANGSPVAMSPYVGKKLIRVRELNLVLDNNIPVLLHCSNVTIKMIKGMR